MGAAERTGVTGLQGQAVGFQALDALFLGQQLLLVAHPFFLGLVLAAQGRQCLLLLQQGRGAGLQGIAQLLGIVRQRLALLGMLQQLLPGLLVLLRGLPEGAQLAQAAAMRRQKRLLRCLRVLRSRIGLLLRCLGLLQFGGLCGYLLLQRLALLLGMLQRGLRLRQLPLLLLALRQLLAPAAQLVAQCGMGRVLLQPVLQIALLGLQLLQRFLGLLLGL